MNSRVRTALLPAVCAVLIIFTVMQGGFQNGDMMINVVFLAAMLVLIGIVYAIAFQKMRKTSSDLYQATETILDGKTYEAFTQEIFEDNKKADAARLKNRNVSFIGNMRSIVFSDVTVNEDWRRLLNDWTASGGEGCCASDYINEDEILENCHAGICAQMPGILTALGILGTFIGLVVGLNRFDFSNSDQMVYSVQALVAGLNVAFYTSIYGVSLSIVFNIVFRSELTDLRMKLNRFYDAFDTALTPVTVKNRSEDVYESLIEQTVALAEIEKHLSQDLGRNLGSSISKELMPEFDRINGSLSKMMLDFQKEQARALDGIVDAFVNRMSGSLDGHVDTLGQSVERLSAAQEAMTADLRALLEEIAKTGRNTSTINRKADKIIGSLESYVGNLEQATEKSIAINEQMANYGSAIGESLSRQEATLVTLSGHEKTLGETCTSLQESQRELSAKLQTFTDAAATLSGREQDPMQIHDIKDLLISYTDSMLAVQKSYTDRLEQLDQARKEFQTETSSAVKASLDALLEEQKRLVALTTMTASRLQPDNKELLNTISKPGFLSEKPDDKEDPVQQLMVKMDTFMENQKEFQQRLMALEEERSRPFFSRLVRRFKR